MKQSNIKIFLLQFSVIVHVIFQLACIIFIVTTSLKSHHSSLIDLLVSCVVISFLLFKRCILIDIYDYIKYKDNLIENLPYTTNDNFLRHMLKKGINSTEDLDVDYTQFRLDIIDNLDPMHLLNDKKLYKNMFYHKMQYILINIILILMLIYKYNLYFLIPLLIGWLLSIFQL